MSLVIDASVVLKLFLPEAGSERAREIFEGSAPRWAPDLIVAEVCNGLWRKVRVGDLTADAAPRVLASLEPLFDDLAPSPPLAERALRLATELDHPAYDCFYLALAERRGATLVTTDRRLLAMLDRLGRKDAAIDLNDAAGG